jgi:hypothetical protein
MAGPELGWNWDVWDTKQECCRLIIQNLHEWSILKLDGSCSSETLVSNSKTADCRSKGID